MNVQNIGFPQTQLFNRFNQGTAKEPTINQLQQDNKAAENFNRPQVQAGTAPGTVTSTAPDTAASTSGFSSYSSQQGYISGVAEFRIQVGYHIPIQQVAGEDAMNMLQTGSKALTTSLELKVTQIGDQFGFSDQVSSLTSPFSETVNAFFQGDGGSGLEPSSIFGGIRGAFNHLFDMLESFSPTSEAPNEGTVSTTESETAGSAEAANDVIPATNQIVTDADNTPVIDTAPAAGTATVADNTTVVDELPVTDSATVTDNVTSAGVSPGNDVIPETDNSTVVDNKPVAENLSAADTPQTTADMAASEATPAIGSASITTDTSNTDNTPAADSENDAVGSPVTGSTAVADNQAATEVTPLNSRESTVTATGSVSDDSPTIAGRSAAAANEPQATVRETQSAASDEMKVYVAAFSEALSNLQEWFALTMSSLEDSFYESMNLPRSLDAQQPSTVNSNFLNSYTQQDKTVNDSSVSEENSKPSGLDVAV